MRVPLPKGLEGVEGLPRTRRLLQNCWNNNKGELIGRPGLTELNTTGRVARGQFTWDDSLYQVVSQDLIKITDTGAFTVVGTIAGVENVKVDVTFTQAVIVVAADDGKTYTLDDADVLADISGNPNMVPNRDLAQINGRIVYIPFNGDPAYFSDIGDAGSIQPESFFDAEILPDKNNSVFNFKETLYIGGTDSIELFLDTGATPTPFRRIDRANITNGVIGGVLEYNETFLFIGREKNQGFGIYAIDQGYAPKMSNEAIDLILSEQTEIELENATAARFKWRGYDVATFQFGNRSFAFFAGNWSVFDSVVNGISKPWRAGFITQFRGTYYTAFEDKIGFLDKVNTDYDEKITRIIDTGLEQEDNEWLSIQSIDLGISQGFSRTEGSVALRMSRDGLTYGEPLYRELGDLGQYAKILSWNYPGGLGAYEGFVGIRIYTTEDLPFSNDYLTLRPR